MTTALELSKIYTFNTLAPAILGTTIKNAKVLTIMDYDTAMAFANVELLYRQVYPNLPAGTIDSAKSCTYYLFKSESGEKIVLADQWIDMSTLDLITHINIQVNFTNGSLQDIPRIRDALNALGYMNFVIKQL